MKIEFDFLEDGSGVTATVTYPAYKFLWWNVPKRVKAYCSESVEGTYWTEYHTGFSAPLELMVLLEARLRSYRRHKAMERGK